MDRYMAVLLTAWLWTGCSGGDLTLPTQGDEVLQPPGEEAPPTHREPKSKPKPKPSHALVAAADV
jgi:hypothetical protein